MSGLDLEAEEIDELIRAVTNGTLSQAQIAAFLTACFIRGMSCDEAVSMTRSMTLNGSIYDFRDIGIPVVDKHSTGGVGDKISLLVVPLAASCGLAVPMFSGRGLGHTGGTIDKLESIPGFRAELKESEMRKMIENHGAFFACQTKDIAPADRILYAVRDEIGAVGEKGLIASSIMSKKLAERPDGVVLDMKVGRGAFMKDMESARELATLMKAIAEDAEIEFSVVFSAMDNPIGYNVGNCNEVAEALRALEGEENEELRLLAEEITAEMLLIGAVEENRYRALEKVRKAWDSGLALEKFKSIIRAQGGRLEKMNSGPVFELPFLAKSDGVVENIDAMQTALAAIAAGAGRQSMKDRIDPAAGITLLKKTGDTVVRGEPLAYVSSSEENRVKAATKLAGEAISINENPDFVVKKKKIIIDWLR